MPSLTPVFERVATSQGEISGADRDRLEEFIVTLYCATFGGQKVNDARRHLFTSKGKTMENIPPTQLHRASILNDLFCKRASGTTVLKLPELTRTQLIWDG